MKTYICTDCGTTFSLGRGRPPKVAYCAKHKPAQAVIVKPERQERPKNNRKAVSPTPSTGIIVRNISVVPMNLEIHGARPGGPAITEPCPNCNYAYADGGYCPECGWSKPINRIPFGTASGEKWKR